MTTCLLNVSRATQFLRGEDISTVHTILQPHSLLGVNASNIGSSLACMFVSDRACLCVGMHACVCVCLTLWYKE